MLRTLDVDIKHHGVSARHQPWDAAIATGIITAIAYFLAARLGLVLRTELEGVAVFWPASGVAVGILIASGPRARWPVAIGVVVATIVANLLGDRNLGASIFSGLCNAGETILTAWLVVRWFGPSFKLDNLDRVLGFLLAATIGAAFAAIGGAITMQLFHTTAPAFSIWQVWFASDGLGIVTIAPVLIGLAQIWREVRPRRELIEGGASLVILAGVSALILALPPGPWATALPAAMLFPQLLWLAARCPPVYAAAAAFIVAFAIVWATSFGIGYFGDSRLPFEDAHARARKSACWLPRCARSSWRRCSRTCAVMKWPSKKATSACSWRSMAPSSAPSARTLRLVASGAMSALADSTDMRCCPRPSGGEALRRPGRSACDVDKVCRRKARGGVCKAEYRVTYPPGHPQAGEVRWVAVEGTVVRNAQGRPARLLGVTRDITKDRIAEDGLRKRERVFRELLDALPGAVYTTDATGRVTFFNRAAVDIWGSCPRIGAPDGRGLASLPFGRHADGRMRTAHWHWRLKEDRPIRGIEVIGERADGTRVHFIPYPTPLHDELGALVGAVNMLMDITELKRTEAALRDSETRLRQALTAGRVIAFEWDPRTGLSQRSDNAVEILGWDPVRPTTGLATPSWLGCTRRIGSASRRTCTASAPTIPPIRPSSASCIRTATWSGSRRRRRGSSTRADASCASRA